MLASNRKNIIIKIILIFFICIILFEIKSLSIVEQTELFYVNDYANLLNEDTKNYIVNINQDLENKTGAQIVVVTVQNLEGNSLEEYATKLFRKFGIGDRSKNNGVLLLLALEERQFRVEVGYGLEGVLPDGKTGRIQDNYIIPYLKENNWNDGIRNGFNAILDEIVKEYGIQIDAESAVQIQEDMIGINESQLTSVILVWICVYMIANGSVNKKNKKKFLTTIILDFIVSSIFTGVIVKDVKMIILILLVNILIIIIGIITRRKLWGNKR